MNFQDSLANIANTRQRYLDFVPPGQQQNGLPPLGQTTTPAAPVTPTPPVDAPINPGNDALPPPATPTTPANGSLPPLFQPGNWQNAGSFFPALFSTILGDQNYSAFKDRMQPFFNQWTANQPPAPPAGGGPGLPPLGGYHHRADRPYARDGSRRYWSQQGDM